MDYTWFRECSLSTVKSGCDAGLTTLLPTILSEFASPSTKDMMGRPSIAGPVGRIIDARVSEGQNRRELSKKRKQARKCAAASRWMIVLHMLKKKSTKVLPADEGKRHPAKGSGEKRCRAWATIE